MMQKQDQQTIGNSGGTVIINGAPELCDFVEVSELSFSFFHYALDYEMLIGVIEDTQVVSRAIHSFCEFLGVSRDSVLGSICMWKRVDRKFVNTTNIPLDSPPSCAYWEEAHKWLIMGQSNGVIRIYQFSDDLTSCNQIRCFKGHEDKIRCVQYWSSPNLDAQLLITAADDKCLRVYEPQYASPTPVNGSICGDSFIASLAYDSKNQLVYLGNWAENILVYDIQSKPPVLVSTLVGHEGSVRSLVMDEPNERLISGSFDCSIIIWDVSIENQMISCQQIKRLYYHNATVTTLHWDPERGILFSGDYTGYIFVWDLTTFTPIRSWLAHDDEIRKFQWIPSNGVLLSGGDDSVIRIWRLPDNVRSSASAIEPSPSPHIAQSTLSASVSSVDESTVSHLQPVEDDQL